MKKERIINIIYTFAILDSVFMVAYAGYCYVITEKFTFQQWVLLTTIGAAFTFILMLPIVESWISKTRRAK